MEASCCFCLVFGGGVVSWFLGLGCWFGPRGLKWRLTVARSSNLRPLGYFCSADWRQCGSRWLHDLLALARASAGANCRRWRCDCVSCGKRQPRESKERALQRRRLLLVFSFLCLLRSSGGLWRHVARALRLLLLLLGLVTDLERGFSRSSDCCGCLASVRKESESEREERERELVMRQSTAFPKRGWWVGLCFVVELRRRFRERFSSSRRTVISNVYSYATKLLRK